MRTRVKICGITNIEDAKAAISLGVDALGFIFAESPRKIEPDKARKIILNLPPIIGIVGVFVDEKEEIVKEIASHCGLNTLQFHGSETPEYCNLFPHKIIKAFRIKDEMSLKEIPHYQRWADAFLLDTYKKGIRGGTGRTFDWKLAIKSKKFGPIILSGGLRPDNVKDAILEVRPYGVDVGSGVESLPGKKDYRLLEEFITQVKEADYAAG
ncbi:MAG TPA: phosphoribosylanthranilate isomerase [Syntrophaceae bacterium]|nr:phosphoribosylanthranilate isomerase [Syntrophaceae bacterium]